MATVSVTMPDGIVDDLVAALADFLGRPVPTTPQGKADLARDFMKAQAKAVLLDYRGRQAAQAARTKPDDPAVAW